MRKPVLRVMPWLVLVVTLATSPPVGGQDSSPDRPPFAGKFLAVTIRGRNYPLPFQDAEVRYLGEKCYLVGKIIPNILPKERRGGGRVWFPIDDLAQIDEFDSLAQLREFYNLAR